MKTVMVVVLVLLAAIVPQSTFAAEKPFGTIGTTATATAVAKAKPAVAQPIVIVQPKVVRPKAPVKIAVNIGGRNDRRNDRRNQGGIKLTLGSVKLSLGADNRYRNDYRSDYRRDDSRYDDRGYRNDSYRDDCGDGLEWIPGVSPNDPDVHVHGAVQFKRNDYVIASYEIVEIRKDGVYGRRALGTKRVYAEDEHHIF